MKRKKINKKIMAVCTFILILSMVLGGFYLNSEEYHQKKLGDGSALQRSQYFLNEEFGEEWNVLYEKEVYRVDCEGGWSQIYQGVIDTDSINVWGGNFDFSLRGRDTDFYFYYPTEEGYPTIRGDVHYDQGEIAVDLGIYKTKSDGHADNRGYDLRRNADGETELKEQTAISAPKKEYSTDDSEFRERSGGISAEEVLSFVEEQYYGYVEKLDTLTEKYFPVYLETISDEQRLKWTYAG